MQGFDLSAWVCALGKYSRRASVDSFKSGRSHSLLPRMVLSLPLISDSTR